jgi:hypothetical protein
MTEAQRITGVQGPSVRPPFKPYAWKDGNAEPAAVTAARARRRALNAMLHAAEAMPDPAPGYEWHREMGDDGD